MVPGTQSQAITALSKGVHWHAARARSWRQLCNPGTLMWDARIFASVLTVMANGHLQNFPTFHPVAYLDEKY